MGWRRRKRKGGGDAVRERGESVKHARSCGGICSERVRWRRGGKGGKWGREGGEDRVKRLCMLGGVGSKAGRGGGVVE